ncbi:hypothetical protein [Alicyclobacillus ferrooxydans]|uniref:Uncharacterized protein n=1 Tax=Alicyclobacillus ferrooxydans TaxID=471514 RepID=A0A0P9END3_9BACL|nr:hypothetical protein [Alicyclobacillus ferrooxydans]KPV44951.1 hypothetical protein AN477_04940 [Alicyclobacillus ferrooxydans]
MRESKIVIASVEYGQSSLQELAEQWTELYVHHLLAVHTVEQRRPMATPVQPVEQRGTTAAPVQHPTGDGEIR